METRLRNNAALTLLLAGTALLTLTGAGVASPQDNVAQPLRLAQAQAPAEEKKPEHPAPPQRPQHPPQQQQRPQPHPQAAPPQRPAPPPQAAPHPAPPPQRPAAPPPPHAAPPQRPQVQEHREPPRPPQAQPPAQRPQPPQAAPQQRPQAAPERHDERRPDRANEQRPGSPPPPAAQPQRAPAAQPPATQRPAAPQPNAQPQAVPPSGPRAQPGQPQFQRPPAAQQQPPQPGPNFRPNNPAAAVAPPTQPRDAHDFIRRNGGPPPQGIEQLRKERHETREGNTTFIHEGDRTIVREGNTAIIRHNEANRFAIGARQVQTERRGNNSETVIVLGNGVRIVNETGPDGRLWRRTRRDANGREIVILDNSWAYRRATPPPMFLALPPPVIRIPRDRYILDADRADEAQIYGVLMEPPVEALAEPYTLDQVRYNAPLRDRMPRIDLDINFETGSWQLTPDQVDRLSVVAEAVNRALTRNPREVFMIEGYTDATGNDEDNLSLSDRRAEAVAVALTEQFQVPPENLVTQGYGEQYLKVPTDGPERANRRVAVRRITPLIDQQAQNGAPPPPPPR